tara:strand:- start:8979 stop:9125 length:147 start_codon:yes stop_codon:yes gene_type:complete
MNNKLNFEQIKKLIEYHKKNAQFYNIKDLKLTLNLLQARMDVLEQTKD